MLRIRSFQGLRPADSLADRVACVPYDVVDTPEAAVLAAGNPHSLLHVDRAEIDLPEGTDLHDDAVYAKAVENFRRLQAEGALVRETEPCIFLYRQAIGGHVQTGVAVVCHIDDYENGVIKRHEKTRKDKEDDRTRLIGDLSADTGPVFLTYRDQPVIDRLTDEVGKHPPLYHFTAPDGVEHTVWRIAGGEAFREAFAGVPCAYVADGHHRTASAVRVGRERRAANPGHTGEEDYNWFLCVLFPASQLRILPYNRLVHDLNGRSPSEFLGEIRQRFALTEGAAPEPESPGQVSMYLEGHWYGLTWGRVESADPVSSLDVSVLQDRLLDPVLGIEDPRTSKRIDFVGGIRGVGALVQAVDSGRAAVAFSMHPVTVAQLMAIADADRIMPPKSTWFEPKLRSGLFIHTF
jgi:uncharacterized protein (DUF1015 family)